MTPPSTRTRRHLGAPLLHPHRRAAAGSRCHAFWTPSLVVVADCVTAWQWRRAARFVGQQVKGEVRRLDNQRDGKKSLFFSSLFYKQARITLFRMIPLGILRVADSLKFEAVKT